MTESTFRDKAWMTKARGEHPVLSIETDDKWLIDTIMGAMEVKVTKLAEEGEFEECHKYLSELLEMADEYTKLEEYESKVIDDESLPEV